MKKSLRLFVLSALVLTAMAFSAVGAMALAPMSGTGTPAASVTSDPKQEVVGIVTALDANTIAIDGTVYNLATFTQIHGAIQVGDTVKLEFVTNPDGSLTASEVGKPDSFSSSDDPSGAESISTPEPDSTEAVSSDQGSSNGSSSDFSGGSSRDKSGGDSGHDASNRGSSSDSAGNDN